MQRESSIEHQQLSGVLDRAAALIAQASCVVITAGAGMSVDSGLPDYRGKEGFWRAYPMLREMGVSFEALSQPQWFEEDPTLAWGFLAHCDHLYRSAVPHDGYVALRRLEAAHGKAVRVFTSNIDGAFVKSGFADAQVYECHGAFRLLQCTDDACAARHEPWPCGDGIVNIHVDEATMRADPATMPRCHHCGALARPNMLLFEDPRFAIIDNLRRQRASERAVNTMLLQRGSVVVIEGGSGPTVPTVRRFGEYCYDAGAALIRINLRESDVPERMAEAPNVVSVPMTCKDALVEIERRVAALLLAGQASTLQEAASAAAPARPDAAVATPAPLLPDERNPYARLREDELLV